MSLKYFILNWSCFTVCEGGTCSIMAKVLGSGRKVSKFELQSHTITFTFELVHLGKGMNLLLILPAISLLFFYKDDFSIKSPTKVDMPLNKETNQTCCPL